MSGGARAIPRTCAWIVTSKPRVATIHHRARPVRCACQAPASATLDDRAIRFGFQITVDSRVELAETAMSSPATKPASGPPIDRASHHVTPTAAMPARAIAPTTTVGLPLEIQANGARR